MNLGSKFLSPQTFKIFYTFRHERNLGSKIVGTHLPIIPNQNSFPHRLLKFFTLSDMRGI
jgi:hypothetical protein